MIVIDTADFGFSCHLGGHWCIGCREITMPIPTHYPCGMRLDRKPMSRNQRFCSLHCFRKVQATLRDLKKLGIKPRYEWVQRDGVDMFMLVIPGIETS